MTTPTPPSFTMVFKIDDTEVYEAENAGLWLMGMMQVLGINMDELFGGPGGGEGEGGGEGGGWRRRSEPTVPLRPLP